MSVQTSALCNSQFIWLDNQKAQTPCLVAAYVLAACAPGGSFTTMALSSGQTYGAPNASTGNPCYCSWSAYNLLSACTVCQGETSYDWPSFVENCPEEFRPITFWPNQIHFPLDTALPFWATTDPSTWPSDKFNVTTARTLWLEGHTDVIPGPLPRHPSSPTGVPVIVGATVGGVVFLFLTGLIAFFVIRRRYASQAKPSVNTPSSPISSEKTRRKRPLSGSTMVNAKHDTGFDLLKSTAYITSPFPGVDNYHSNATPISTSSGPISPSLPSQSARRHGHEHSIGGTESADPILTPTGNRHLRSGSGRHHAVQNRLADSVEPVLTASRPAEYNPPIYSPTGFGRNIAMSAQALSSEFHTTPRDQANASTVYSARAGLGDQGQVELDGTMSPPNQRRRWSWWLDGSAHVMNPDPSSSGGHRDI